MKNIIKWLFIVLAIAIALTVLLNTVTTAIANFTWPGLNAEEVEPVYKDSTSQTNGGLTPAQLAAMEEDPGRPTNDDVFRNFIVRETDKYVIIYRKSIVASTGAEIWPNMSFVKTANGLVWDGAMHFTASIKANWWNGSHDWANAKFKMTMEDITNATYNNVQPGWLIDAFRWALNINTIGLSWVLGSDLISQSLENIVTFSNFNTNFAPNFWAMNGFAKLRWQTRETKTLHDQTQQYLMQEIQHRFFHNFTDIIGIDNKQFQTLGNATNKQFDSIQMRMGSTSIQTNGIFNSFATYLWNNSKSGDLTQKTSFVDVSGYFNNYIAEDSQAEYPIAAEDKELYNNELENYAIYKNKIIADAFYFYDNTTKIKRDPIAIDKYIQKQGLVVAPVIEAPSITYAKVNLSLVNSNSSDISLFDITQKPITLSISGKTIVYNQQTHLTQPRTFAVELGATLPWTITSEGLVFTNTSGTVQAANAVNNVNFDYTYVHNAVGVNISLIPITSIDTTAINLVANPVRIVLTGTNNEGTYTFLFNTNAKLNLPQTLLLKIATYNWQIISDQLLFNELTGTGLTVSTEARNFNFTYFLATEDVFSFSHTNSWTTDYPSQYYGGITVRISSLDLLKTYFNTNFVDVTLKMYTSQDVCLGESTVRLTTSAFGEFMPFWDGFPLDGGQFGQGRIYKYQALITVPGSSSIFVTSSSLYHSFDRVNTISILVS